MNTPTNGNLAQNRGLQTPASVSRYKPYFKTPASRRLTVYRKTAKTPQKQNTENLKAITRKTWNTYRVSPLYKFNYDALKLKFYGRLLGAHIEAVQQKGLAFEVESTANAADFGVFEGLKIDPDGPEAILIHLKLKTGNESETKVVLSAILCCPVSTQTDEFRGIHPAFTWLPLLLIKGPVGLSRVLTDWLQSTFDCCVSKFIMRSLQLSWLAAVSAGQVPEKGSMPFELRYSMPSPEAGLSTITLNVDSHHCQKLWQCIHDEDSEEFSDEEVQNFMKSLESHFYHHFKIRLVALPLSRVGTSLAYASSDGKIKLFSENHVHYTLGLLTDFILEQRMIKPSINK